MSYDEMRTGHTCALCRCETSTELQHFLVSPPASSAPYWDHWNQRPLTAVRLTCSQHGDTMGELLAEHLANATRIAQVQDPQACTQQWWQSQPGGCRRSCDIASFAVVS